MNHRRIAHQILARLPTNVNNVSTVYINSLIKKYTRKEKEFNEIKRIINQNKKHKSKEVMTYGKIKRTSN
ncbi:hypothetical protein ACWEX2_03345 [Staphylococcus xylosus]|uniref:Uncharacterized protein n=1 Tax=Staphylococcus xylosus TaxID=1288 RepID=A0AAQ0RYA3_STAXY|nr:hypothetical protein [Staphylococcus xylosus]MEB7719716.1 hypothetical protein [Staphylococcus xylosus]PTH91024.1 hypothetical protein BU108_11595 [Staphylococcus xylosus]RIM75230.1 hypothetical protein BU121_12460 [Staphylococcus xylosus]RIM85376.1 hypothetical protein BU107_12165 [Staphylococcus xylosus]RIM93377.1 hypothetical protein BU104_03310 [Staphylococcus xylosus]